MRQDKVVSEMLGGESVLAPSDVYSKKFRPALVGGYPRREVDAYLARVADVLEMLIQQVKQLKEQQEEHKGRLQQYHEMEQTLQSALSASQKFGEDALDAARHEADSLIAAARLEKERTLASAAQLPDALDREIRQLRQQRDRLLNEVQGILASHKALLDSHVSAEHLAGDEKAAPVWDPK